MKTLNTLTLIATLATASLSAQTVYNINSDLNVAAAKIPNQCSNCIINIAENATLTINQDIYLQNTTFNGGKIVANKSITFWSNGGFNNTAVTISNGSAITSSGAQSISNSTFIFHGTSKATFWGAVTMTASSMRFLDNSSMESTNAFNLKNNSSLIAGDGSITSKAFIHFNGGTLNEYDNSFVSLSNTNNYYRNWSNYNVVSLNKSVATTFNSINCNASGKNTCDAANVYGPATMNFAGVSANAVMPVKLSGFTARMNGTQVNLTWATSMEKNSSHFDIERSLDGLNWTKVATVKSNGNSSETNNYSYTDLIKANGAVSYRLKMVDQDNAFEYSSIKTVKGESIEMSIFPNPATNYVVISSKDNSGKNVQLINQNGQVVKQVKGNGNINMSVSEFTSGNYFVKVSDNEGTSKTFKLLISK